MQNENYINDKFTIDELLHRSWKYKSSEGFFKFFNFIAGFNHYSRFNTMLVYLQNEAITFFGGTSFWKKKFNRTIKENARPYVILAPMSPVMLVYDIFDTLGKDTPEEFLEKGLGSKPFDVKGKINPEIIENAILTATNLGIKVISKPLSLFNAGYITTIISGKLEITLKQEHSIEQNFSVLIHELAHLFLGHTGHKELFQKSPQKKMPLPQRKLSRTAQELEAETVSYLISFKLGLETRSSEYIAGYIANENDLLQFSYETVIKVTDKIENIFLTKKRKV